MAIASSLFRDDDLVVPCESGGADAVKVSERFTDAQAHSAAEALASVLAAHASSESNAAAAESSVRILGAACRSFGSVPGPAKTAISDSIKAGAACVVAGDTKESDAVVMRKAGAAARMLVEAIGAPGTVAEEASALVEAHAVQLMQLAWFAACHPLAPAPYGIYAACALLRVASRGGPVQDLVVKTGAEVQVELKSSKKKKSSASSVAASLADPGVGSVAATSGARGGASGAAASSSSSSSGDKKSKSGKTSKKSKKADKAALDFAMLGLGVGIPAPDSGAGGKKSKSSKSGAGKSSSKKSDASAAGGGGAKGDSAAKGAGSGSQKKKKKAPCVGASCGAVDLVGALVEKKSFLSSDPLIQASGRTRSHVRRLSPVLVCLVSTMGDVAGLWPSAHEQIAASPAPEQVRADLMGATSGSAGADIQRNIEDICRADGLAADAPAGEDASAAAEKHLAAGAEASDGPKQLANPAELSPRPPLTAHDADHSAPSVFWRTLAALLTHVASCVRHAAAAALARACRGNLQFAAYAVHALWFDLCLSQVQDCKQAQAQYDTVR